MAEDTAALLRQLSIDVVDFVGYSLGGGVALQIAIQRPSLVRPLVFAGATSYDPAGLYPEVRKPPTPHDLDGSVWHQRYLRVAPDPEGWPALVALRSARWTEQSRA